MHLAHPLGVKAFSYRRVKKINATPQIWRICCGWGGYRTPGSRRRKPGSCGSWCGTGPNWSRCDPECKAQVHAVLAKGGIWVPMTDLFGVEGNLLLDKVTMPAPYKARIASLRRFIEAFDAGD